MKKIFILTLALCTNAYAVKKQEQEKAKEEKKEIETSTIGTKKRRKAKIAMLQKFLLGDYSYDKNDDLQRSVRFECLASVFGLRNDENDTGIMHLNIPINPPTKDEILKIENVINREMRILVNKALNDE